jgi:hypothetical protein
MLQQSTIYNMPQRRLQPQVACAKQNFSCSEQELYSYDRCRILRPVVPMRERGASRRAVLQNAALCCNAFDGFVCVSDVETFSKYKDLVFGLPGPSRFP